LPARLAAGRHNYSSSQFSRLSSVSFPVYNLDSERVKQPRSQATPRWLTHVPPQGVVTYTSPVEAFATGIKNFDR